MSLHLKIIRYIEQKELFTNMDSQQIHMFNNDLKKSFEFYLSFFLSFFLRRTEEEAKTQEGEKDQFLSDSQGKIHVPVTPTH